VLIDPPEIETTPNFEPVVVLAATRTAIVPVLNIVAVEAVAVAVSGQFSLAALSQGEKAGRALLRMKNGQWEIVVCGGKELKQVSSLVKAGVPPSDSELLVSDLSKAELKLPAALQKRFDSFLLEIHQ